MGYVGVYSTTRCAARVQYVYETGLRTDAIGFLTHVDILSCSLIAVTDSEGSNAKGSIGASPSSNPPQGRIL